MESITVLVEKSKKEAFLSMLELLSFVRVETKKEKIKRYKLTAPENITLSEDEVMYEVKAVRNKKAKKGARSKA